MRLRSLQIKGFKSFANDTILNFDEDVIGVVGPNGSGKSNIVDAIRWVLGEQKSRELRLDKMSDIIFNGTKTRKEAGVAQVSLTFDNTKNVLPTEYQSVTISRLLYRSGESEYRLNNITCRLKDIRSLFIDTGIGSNSYAIIALGMVDDILSDKDQARRKMFEQAAGISKYKTRKRETLNKLKNTSEDLDRIEDLLFEIENNLKSLEKQAKRTKKYFEIKEKYKELSINFSLRSISTLKERYKSISKEIKEEEEKYGNINAQLTKSESELESIKSQNLNQEQNLSDSQRALNDLVNTIRTDENNKNLSSQKLEFKEQEINKLEGAISRAKEELESVENSIKGIEMRLEVEEEKLTGIQSQTETALTLYQNNKEEYAKVRSELDAHAKKKQSLQQQAFEFEKKLAIYQNNLENAKRDYNNYNSSLADAEIQIKKLDEQFSLVQKEVKLKEEEVTVKEDFLNKKKEEIEGLELKLNQQKDEMASLLRKKDAAHNEYDLLKSMVDSYEGFPASIKFLSNHWKQKVPILSDLLDVEEGYKGSIEQYLDNYLNYFVTDNLEQAKKAISLLADSQQGRASFFLRDKFESFIPQKAEVNIPDVIPARNVVKIEKKYEKILDFLLDNVFIYRGDISHIDILGDYEGLTFLSANGRFIKKANFIQGGSVGLFEGKRIGRKKNLEKLEKKIKKLDEEIKVLQEKQDKTRKKLELSKSSNLNQDLDQAKNELKIAREKLFQARYRWENNSKEFAQQKERLERIISETKKLEQLIEENSTGLKLVKSELSQLSNGKLFSDEEIDDLNYKLSESQENYNKLNIESIRQQNLVENFRREKEVKINRKNDVEVALQRDKNQIDLDQKEIKRLSDQINELNANLEQKYALRDEKKKDLNEVERLYYSARNIISEKEDEVRKLNRSLNQSQIEINQLKEKFNDVKFNISGVGERLKIEFDIQLNDIINDEVDESMPYDELEEKVEKLKKRIANFGEINPMAVTAYDEMKERYDTIQGQREDILEAKKSLLKTIDEIETKATERFMEAFTKVRENFIEVFRTLFTRDDTCDLILLEPSNPLESEIEIIAKPKGKKPKSLNQLSGGEKTLTATALLFALYLLKPAPFCIFDEVDAPLDDANIQKFNNIIKDFSQDSQFIIVTHNKSTMAAVDVLYGVYMQEQGVSAVTPVDFRSYEHQPVMEVVNN